MQIVRNVSSQACLSSTNYNDYIFPSGGWAKRGVNYRSLTPSSTFPRCTENSERYLIIKALCRDYCHFTFIASSSSSSSIASHKLTRTSQVLNWALRRFGIYRESASAGGWHTTLIMRWASNQIQGLATIPDPSSFILLRPHWLIRRQFFHCELYVPQVINTCKCGLQAICRWS